MRLLLIACLALLVPGRAQAAWLQASSAHFVVYADSGESKVRDFSQKLERFHAALELVMARTAPPPSPSNRVTVFLVSGEAAVRRLYGANSKNIGGFYLPRAGGSIAIIPEIGSTGQSEYGLDFPMIVLLHEYAHHFQISSTAYTLPRWMSEGSAEFFASAAFPRDGGVGLGRPANHRAAELYLARDVTAAELLDPEAYEKRHKSGSFDAFYGKSWLLYHYLLFEPSRRGQLQRYVQLLAEGKSSREAGLDAFGALDVLERNLDSYMRRPNLRTLSLPAARLRTGPVEVRRLSEGEGAMMPLRIRSNRGVNEEQAAALVVEARAVAGRYPDDAGVLTALAEAEHDAGNDAAAIAAADKAIKLDPTRVNAYVQKGYAMFRQAAQAGGDEAAYKRARAPFVALNRIENDNPLALMYYYFSFVRAGIKPTQLAVDGLARAADLAPFDLGLRMTLAMQQVRDGRPGLAKRNLAPVAYSPHGGPLAEAAQAVLTRLESEPGWKGEGFEVPKEDKAER